MGARQSAEVQASDKRRADYLGGKVVWHAGYRCPGTGDTFLLKIGPGIGSTNDGLYNTAYGTQSEAEQAAAQSWHLLLHHLSEKRPDLKGRHFTPYFWHTRIKTTPNE